LVERELNPYDVVDSGFPIAGATFTQDGFLLQKIAASNVGTLGLVLMLLVRIYSGWGYAGSRLQSKVIEYEGKILDMSSANVGVHCQVSPSDLSSLVDFFKL